MMRQKASGGREDRLRLVTFIVSTSLSPIPAGSAIEIDSMSCCALATGGVSAVPVGSVTTRSPGRTHGLRTADTVLHWLAGVGQVTERSTTVFPAIAEAPETWREM